MIWGNHPLVKFWWKLNISEKRYTPINIYVKVESQSDHSVQSFELFRQCHYNTLLIRKIGNKHIYSLTLADIRELLELTLKNNVFQYNSQTFLQIRGLAMGGRISGTLAILVMDRFETSHIYNQLLPASLVYMRYVDDTGTIANNIEEAQAMLKYLNDQHPTIKFDLETPDKNGYLPILDVMIKIDEAGEISRKHYRKTANRGLTLNFLSHHASAIKRAIVNNELQRAYDYSTVDNRTSAVQEAKKKLSNNNYPDKWLHPKAKSRKSQKPKPVYDSVLRLPFISDSFNAKVRRVLKQSNLDNVRLVNPRPKTLQQLVTKRSQPQSCPLRKCPISQSVQNCGATFVIYKATCLMCGDFYVGSTMRPLHIRAREHMYATRQHNSSSALGEHFGERHPTAATPSIEFEILHRSEKKRAAVENWRGILHPAPTTTSQPKSRALGHRISAVDCAISIHLQDIKSHFTFSMCNRSLPLSIFYHLEFCYQPSYRN